MSLSERDERFKARVKAYMEKLMGEEMEEYYVRNDNTKAVREKLIKTNHYHHILQMMGDTDLDQSEVNTVFALAKEKIVKVKDKDEQRREVIQMNLVDGHTAAWNIANYHYEKATKTLCQMMITFMDYIIQEKGEDSILYEDLDKSKYFNLLDEITALNEDYEDSYFYLCSYDYCTDKIGDFMKVPEYKTLDKMHERLIRNGNPDRVTKVMKRLKEICGEARREVFIDIEKAYTPEPLYSGEILELCYQKAIEQSETEEIAMTDFTALVAKVNQIYQRNVRA